VNATTQSTGSHEHDVSWCSAAHTRISNAGGKTGINAGTRNTRRGRIQKFFCQSCLRHFCASPIPHRQYSPAVILGALTSYNLGTRCAINTYPK